MKQEATESFTFHEDDVNESSRENDLSTEQSSNLVAANGPSWGTGTQEWPESASLLSWSPEDFKRRFLLLLLPSLP
jgi:hypothetical protein